MPLTDKGRKILTSMGKTYKNPKKAKSVFYASINSGKIKGAEGRAEGGRAEHPIRSAATPNKGITSVGRHDLPQIMGVVAPGMHMATRVAPKIKWDTKTVGSGIPAGPGSTVIEVDPSALNRAYLKTDPEFAKNLMSGRMDRIKEYVDAGNAVSMPEVGAVGNRLGFVNGRHRAQLAADRGESSIPLAVDKGNEQSVMDIISKFGRAEGGKIPLPRRRPLGVPGDEETEISARQYKPQMSDSFGIRRGNPYSEPYGGPSFSPRLMPYRGGTDTGTAIKAPEEVRLASGGAPTAPWYERGAARSMASGLLRSATPGRTDKLNLGVGSGSYVFPADTVSALGQGNSMAGGKMLDRIFKRGPSGANLALRGRKSAGRMFMADGGDVDVADGGNHEPVDIIAAGGEYILTPEEVASLGGGDVDIGHKVLDDFVLSVRKKHMQTLKNLPRPKR